MLYETFLFDNRSLTLPFPEATEAEVLGWGFKDYIEKEGVDDVGEIIVEKVKEAPDYLPPKRRERFFDYIRGQALPFAREFLAEDVNVSGCSLAEWEERWCLALAFSFMEGTRGFAPFSASHIVPSPDSLRQGIGSRQLAEKSGNVGQWDWSKALARVGAAYVKVSTATRLRYMHTRGAFYWMIHCLPPMAADAFNAAELAHLHSVKPESAQRDAAFRRALSDRVEAHVSTELSPVRGDALHQLGEVMAAARRDGVDEFGTRFVGLTTYRSAFAEGLRKLAREVESFALPAEAIEQAEEKMHEEVTAATPLFLPSTGEEKKKS